MTLVGLVYGIVVVDFIATLELIRLVVPHRRVVSLRGKLTMHSGVTVGNKWSKL